MRALRQTRRLCSLYWRDLRVRGDMADRGSGFEGWEDRLRAVERITILFRAERLVYLAFAITAFVALLACLILALVRQGQDITATLGAFGSSGVVAFTSSRVLLMWNRALNIVTTSQPDLGGPKQ